ncbi:MAG: class IV adenylate cyclase [Pirellulaceae bacterium]|nr:class IV adenylate cyclase [Pirellulaceae bacterium]
MPDSLPLPAGDSPGDQFRQTAPGRRNIELKLRVVSLEPFRIAAHRLGLRKLADQWQRDTYFRCASGRLKLREFRDREAELIWYRRADQAEARASDYEIVPVSAAAELARLLEGACGVRCVVVKHREIWLYHNVRLHLDRVERLGEYVELESVVGPEVDEPLAWRRLRSLFEQLPLADCPIESRSYSDLMGGD